MKVVTAFGTAAVIAAGGTAPASSAVPGPTLEGHAGLPVDGTAIVAQRSDAAIALASLGSRRGAIGAITGTFGERRRGE